MVNTGGGSMIGVIVVMLVVIIHVVIFFLVVVKGLIYVLDVMVSCRRVVWLGVVVVRVGRWRSGRLQSRYWGDCSST